MTTRAAASSAALCLLRRCTCEQPRLEARLPLCRYCCCSAWHGAAWGGAWARCTWCFSRPFMQSGGPSSKHPRDSPPLPPRTLGNALHAFIVHTYVVLRDERSCSWRTEHACIVSHLVGLAIKQCSGSTGILVTSCLAPDPCCCACCVLAVQRTLPRPV